MKIIGLTGGISSGKSTVSRIILSTKNPPPVIDLDLIARQVVARGTPAYRQILEQFGKEVVDDDGKSSLLEEGTGEIDRKRLGALIFADPVQRKKLQSITHRPIFFAMLKQLLWHFLRGTDMVILDAPLLYESGLHRLTTSVVVVYAPDDVQLKRLMKRDSIDEREARQKIQSQIPLEKKRQMADFVVDNSSELEHTELSAKSLLYLLQLQRGPLLLSRWAVLAILLAILIILVILGTFYVL